MTYRYRDWEQLISLLFIHQKVIISARFPFDKLIFKVPGAGNSETGSAIPMNKLLILSLLAISANCFGQPLTCVASSGVSAPARAEGLTELVSDFQVICTGGTPTAPGLAIPTVTIQIFLNTQITSRCVESAFSVGCLGLHSEALLLLDEPAQANQFGCPINTCINVGNGLGTAPYGALTQTGAGTPASPGIAGANKNLFQGIQTAANAITFLNIPIDPPGNGPGGAQRILRITNLRANANGLGVASGNNAPTSVTETIVPSPLNFLPVSGLSTQAVASVQTSMSTSVVTPVTFQKGTPENAALANDPNSSGVSQFSVRFRELFSAAFKKRNIATSAADPAALTNQNDLTVGSYNTESGFYNNALTLPVALSHPGLSDSGTALMARFYNVPAGVSLFSRLSGTVNGGGAGAVQRVNADVNGAGPYSAMAGNSFGIAPIPIVNGVATAVYEIVESDPNSFATVDIPIYVAYSGVPIVSNFYKTTVVQLTYAPVSTVTVSVAANVLKFADTSIVNPPSQLFQFAGLPAFTIETPHCAAFTADSDSIAAAGGSASVSVATDSGCQWTATTDADWITIFPSGPGHAPMETLHYDVAPSESPFPRGGYIFLHFDGQPSMEDRIFIVVQGAIACTYTVSPSARAFSSAAGTGSVTVSTNYPLCPWTVFPVSLPPDIGFLSVTSAGPGTGGGTFAYAMTQNTGNARTGYLYVTGQNPIAQQVTITQQGRDVPAPLSLNSTSGAGAAHSFIYTFSDPNGWQDIGIVNVLINRALDGNNACYLAYDRPNNVLYLVSDTGPNGGLSALALGSGTVSNSQCTVNGVGSSASGSGNVLTLTLALSFNQANFAGEKITHLAARDVAQNNSGWSVMGVWSVPGLAPAFPSITNITPSQGGAQTQQFAVTYRDVASSANLRTMQLLINSDLNGELACYMGYDHASNQLYLVADFNSSLLLPGIAPNSGTGTVQNSQCIINGAGTTKTESGTDVILTVSLTFKPSFTGPKVAYTGVQTISNANSDWHALGFWNVP